MTEYGNLPTTAQLIFIVDDDQCSRQLLDDILTRNGYATRTFSSGAHVLLALQKESADLILLDIIMPGMDGFEVCQHLKGDETTRYIPVVMVTSLNEKVMRIKGIEVGADDFISKPYDATEILLRARNLLMVKRHYDMLKEHAALLEQQVRLRTAELENAMSELKSTQQQMLQQEKMATIGQLTAGLAHEINNPVSFIASNIGVLAKYCDSVLKFMALQQKALLSGQHDAQSTEQLLAIRKQMKIERIVKDIPEMNRETMEGVERIKSIVRDLKCFSRIDEAEQKLADINQCLESTLNIAHNELKYKTTLKREYGELPQLRCYPQQLNQVFMNLLVNAAQAIEAHGEITVRTWFAGDEINVSISDTGSGIAEEVKAHIFETFFTTKESGKGTGLGLSISNEIIKNHGGEIMVSSEPGKGSTFTVSLPLDGAGGFR
ncbi:MAG: response regulator [Desulfuromonadaceae bacterium]|nr:response regulator [Desulfuromonadaceae bacterium]MDD2849221.1 response regulator [Desulfuromonadaceae bacterium]MDD4129730.1 response regulator [Desulfuromonadaceae bacterium]